MHKRNTKIALLWSGIDVLFRQGLQFGLVVALARVLAPEEFGVAALLLLFTGIAGAIIDAGLSSALIQRQDVDYIDESTVFWCNIGMGLIVGVALWMMGRPIAIFYAEPELEKLMLATAVSVFFGAIGSIHAALLTKILDFRSQAWTSATATTVAGIVAVIMALKGYGVWAIVTQNLIFTSLNSTMLWMRTKWLPASTFSSASVRKLFHFGGYLMFSALLEIVFSRLHKVFIGKIYGTLELGLYDRAESTAQLPLGAFSAIFARVALPLFSATKNKLELKRYMQNSLRTMTLLTTPAMFGLVVVSEPLIHTLFGEQWLPSVLVLQLLCVGGILWPIHIINLTALLSQGYSDLYFRLELVKKIVTIISLAIGSAFGIVGVAISQVICSFIAVIANTYYSDRYFNYGVIRQVSDMLPAIILAAAMASIIYFINLILQLPTPLLLIVLVAFGVVIFAMLAHFFRIPALIDLYKMLKSEK